MANNKILISGYTGFIGNNLFKNIDPENILLINRESFNQNFKIFDYNLNSVDLEIVKKYKLIFIHLATFFSKSVDDNEKIHLGNIEFGNNILENIQDFNILKIIYTNTMYKYYPDENLRESYYCKTKNQFSDIIEKFCNNFKICKDEIFLDNTFGKNDNRDKIIPLIVRELKSGKGNPINNPNNSINLTYVDDVIKNILLSIKNPNSSSTYSLIGKKSLILQSIFDFLYDFSNNGKINIDLIKYVDNEYLKDYPINMLNETEQSDIPLELSRLL